MYAFSGEKFYKKAINFFLKSFNQNKYWNEYVHATIYFLQNNIEKLKECIDLIENGDKKENIFRNIKVVKKLYLGLLNKENNYYITYHSEIK